VLRLTPLSFAVASLAATVLVGTAHADSPPYQPVAEVAFRAGAGEVAPIGGQVLELPSGDLAHSGTVTSTTAFGSTVVPSDGQPSSYVAVTSPDGVEVRWAVGLGGPQPAGLALVGDSLVAATPHELLAWDAQTGSLRWGSFLDRACWRSDVAVTNGLVVVAGATHQADGACQGFVVAYDALSGEQRWRRALTGRQDNQLLHVAGTPDGVLVAGLFSGVAELAGATYDAGTDQSHGLVARLTTQGDLVWGRTFPCTACWGQVDELAVDGDRVLVRSLAPLLPNWPAGRAVGALSMANGMPLWQVRLPADPTREQWSPLAVPRPGVVVAGAAFAGDADFGNGDIGGAGKLTSRGATDVALVGVRTTDGKVVFVDQLGGPGEDVVTGLAASDDGLLLAGRTAVTRADGDVVDEATVARLRHDQRLAVSAPTTASVWSAAVVTASTQSDRQGAFSTSGPCRVQRVVWPEATIRFDHVGACSVTVDVPGGHGFPPARATAVIDVTPVVPVGSYTASAGDYPGRLQGWATFLLPNGSLAEGTITYSPALGTELGLGTHTVAALFTSAAPDVSDGSVSRTLVVGPASPRVSWDAPSDLVYGTGIPASALDAVVTAPDGSPVAGTYRYIAWEPAPNGGKRQIPALGAVLPAGSHSLNLVFTSEDPRYRSVVIAHTVRVLKAQTSLTATGSITGLTMRAVLRDVSNGVPLAGQQLVFTVGDSECIGTTDAEGRASCALSSGTAVPALLEGFEVSFAGGQNHDASAGHGTLS